MATCIPVLNYVAFLIFYIICFYAISKVNSRIVGYAILFVIHASFILFLISNLFSIFQNYGKIPSQYGSLESLSYIAIIAIFAALMSHFVSFILILITLTFFRTKVIESHNASLQLDGENEELIDSFNKYLYTSFAICFVLISMFFYDIHKFTFMSVHFLKTSAIMNFMDNPSFERMGVLVFPVLSFLLSGYLTYISYLQITKANKISYLYYRYIS